MSEDALRLTLQIVAVFIGGSAVQLVIFLLRRKSELRSLDAKADADVVTAQSSYITTLQAGEQQTREELAALKKTHDAERRDLLAALESSKNEVARLSAQVGRLEADLAVARSQIATLTARLQMPRHYKD